MTAAWVGLGVVLLLALLLGWFLLLVDRNPGERDIAWLAGGPVLDAAQAQVYRAYLARHNGARLAGGLVAIAVGLVVAARWSPGNWSVNVSVGLPPPGNLLIWWLGGVVLGTLLAESYRLPRRGAATPRLAVLDSRPAPPLPRVVLAARLLGGLAVAGGAAWLIGRHESAGLAGLAMALLFVGLAEATQRAITDRPRPVGEPALTVDGRLRWFAGTSVAWLELAGATLSLATVLAAVGGWLDTVSLPPVADGLARLGAGVPLLACVVVTVVAILRGRVRPPRGWQPLGQPLTVAAPGVVA